MGVYFSKTGPTAGATAPVLSGVQLAVDEWNEKGGINGAQVEVMSEDDQSTPAGAVNAFNKLVSAKPAFILAPPITAYVLAIEQSLITSGKLPSSLVPPIRPSPGVETVGSSVCGLRIR